MNYESYTIKTQEALQEASSIANKNDNSEIGTEHVLLALLEQQDGLIPPVVERIGISCSELINKTKELINSNPKVSGAAQVYLSSSMQKVLAKAENEMASMHDQFLSTEHILLAITECDDKT
nr:type VI secretion system ATPase TssH [Treponema sp.]